MKNLDDFKNEIYKMELGDSVEIILSYKSNYSDEMDELYTTLTKTRWLDSYTYLLGGTMDNVIAIEASDPDDIDDDGRLKEAQNVVDKIIEYKQPDDISFKNEGNTVIIHAYGGCIRNCEVDNVVYHK